MSSALAVVAVELGLILLTLWVVLYQLVKQQGRMLLRLDEVESRLGLGHRNGSARGLDVLGVRSGPAGLAVGSAFAPFRLLDLSGDPVALEDFRGNPVLLVNWSPQCGYCDLLAKDLAALQAASKAREFRVVLISRGSGEANHKLAEEHGLVATILLLGEGDEGPEAFRNQGTPVAYLLDRDGKVAKPMAVGSDQTLALVRGVVPEGAVWKRTRLPGEKPLSESKLERNGLKAGTPAPAFSLPDLHGRMIALEDFRGRRVLLVFSDPHCGPCEQLAPALVNLHRRQDELSTTIILVGRGELDENRAKAVEHGYEFPVVLQNRWDLSKEYGIFATPVAFLIDEQGVIARDVARGVDAILDLVPEPETTGQRVRGGGRR